ncbi:hypothetical protein EV198_2971 [Roseivirga ehrenbergii]|uniref:Uncharacterized protein n=1 Tax=Roseivirga ehrenbergii (strain DSM 102268 / JCM 13514 / KCTC 12282 / NCIMB 14502 / KMM 6017) TaxID=279360 RepID=A0A150XQV2_ROSEK|nr:hypothetical protein [Roseivirga ehrenbergii]KYG81081.1 hypothetical protein MB14_15000 [Roseivirga ehrenbergii]TCL00954.1 hypothetical protein EV198_2971 [Roseivirga ehrenbergii]
MDDKFLVGWSKFGKMAFGIFIAVLVIGAVFQSTYVKKKGKREFGYFYKTAIVGTISCGPSGSSAGTYFCVDDKRFNFNPYTSNINKYKIFSYLAELGDSIYKPAYSDTLTLIKEGEKYRYTFLKIE